MCVCINSKYCGPLFSVSLYTTINLSFDFYSSNKGYKADGETEDGAKDKKDKREG